MVSYLTVLWSKAVQAGVDNGAPYRNYSGKEGVRAIATSVPTATAATQSTAAADNKDYL